MIAASVGVDGKGEFLSLEAKRMRESRKRIHREGIKIPTSYKCMISPFYIHHKHTLGIINSSKIPHGMTVSMCWLLAREAIDVKVSPGKS